MDFPEFIAKMKKHFGITHGVQKYVDEVMLDCTGKIHLDTLALDDWLHAKHGCYEVERGMSMGDLIKEKYGLEAHDFVASNL